MWEARTTHTWNIVTLNADQYQGQLWAQKSSGWCKLTTAGINAYKLALPRFLRRFTKKLEELDLGRY
jgi:hypothetical protein